MIFEPPPFLRKKNMKISIQPVRSYHNLSNGQCEIEKLIEFWIHIRIYLKILFSFLYWLISPNWWKVCDTYSERMRENSHSKKSTQNRRSHRVNLCQPWSLFIWTIQDPLFNVHDNRPSFYSTPNDDYFLSAPSIKIKFFFRNRKASSFKSTNLKVNWVISQSSETVSSNLK